MKKGKVFIIVVIALAVLAVVLTPFLKPAGQKPSVLNEGAERVVVITLSGSIQEAAGSVIYGGGISPRYVYSQLSRAANDASIKGVVLRIDSPGGSIAASQEIAAMVRDFEKPLVVSMADMAASGGYYISAPALGIVAQPGTMTGSIGVISTVTNMDGLYEKLGIEMETFKTGEHKDMYGRTLTEEERLIMQRTSDLAYQQFISDVARDRSLPLEEVRKLATGELYLGEQALELGLVDRLGGLEEAIDYLAELASFENPVRFEFPPPSFFTQLSEFSYRAVTAFERSVSGPDQLILDLIERDTFFDMRYEVQ